MAGMADGMIVWADGIMVKWWEWSNGGYGGQNGCMGGRNNGQMVGMVEWRVTGFHPSWSTFLRYCIVSKKSSV